MHTHTHTQILNLWDKHFFFTMQSVQWLNECKCMCVCKHAENVMTSLLSKSCQLDSRCLAGHPESTKLSKVSWQTTYSHPGHQTEAEGSNTTPGVHRAQWGVLTDHASTPRTPNWGRGLQQDTWSPQSSVRCPDRPFTPRAPQWGRRLQQDTQESTELSGVSQTGRSHTQRKKKKK